MNSAFMPRAGRYELEEITASEFTQILTNPSNFNKIKSSIGYPENIRVIKNMTGITFSLSRNTTNVSDGDILVIMRLKYRVSDKRGFKGLKPSDFDFFMCQYANQ